MWRLYVCEMPLFSKMGGRNWLIILFTSSRLIKHHLKSCGIAACSASVYGHLTKTKHKALCVELQECTFGQKAGPYHLKTWVQNKLEDSRAQRDIKCSEEFLQQAHLEFWYESRKAVIKMSSAAWQHLFTWKCKQSISFFVPVQFS